jgi:hypothetical protein
MRAARQRGADILQFFRLRNLGHVELMIESGFRNLERGSEIEDLLSMLDRHHAPSGETFAVAGTIHFIEDRNPRIAGTQEISVQRMTMA